MSGLGGDHTNACGGTGERVWAMGRDVGRRVCGGVSDSAGGEDKEYGWSVALQEDVRGRGGGCRAFRVQKTVTLSSFRLETMKINRVGMSGESLDACGEAVS